MQFFIQSAQEMQIYPQISVSRLRHLSFTSYYLLAYHQQRRESHDAK